MESLFESIVSLLEIQLIRRVRHGQIVKKAAVRKQGFKVVRTGNTAHYQKMSAQEMLKRRKSTTLAWRKGKARRLVKTRRSMIKARRKMKILYH